MRRYTECHSYHVSKIIKAPLKYVYDWCTDYREDDNQITGSKTQFRILQKTNRRVIYLSTSKWYGKAMVAVKMVMLRPPKAWYLDQIGQVEDVVGIYTLTRLGPEKTKLNMRFTEKYKLRDAPSKEQDRNDVAQMWNKYVAALEKDYASRR